jgi:hypothetical protein
VYTPFVNSDSGCSVKVPVFLLSSILQFSLLIPFFGGDDLSLINYAGDNCVLQEVGAATSVGAGGMLLLMLGFAMMASFGLY